MKRSVSLVALTVSLSATAQELPPLTVLGERVEAHGTVDIIGRDQIRQSRAISVADLFEKEAGLPVLSFFGNPGLGSPLVGGFAENASSRTLVLIDGLPVSRPDLGGPQWFQLPPEALESVTVTRGSRTVRYGSQALAGVIELETSMKEQAALTFKAGESDSAGVSGSLVRRVGDWSLGVHGGWQESDGWRELTGYRSGAGTLVLASPQDAPWRMRWTLARSDLEFENPGGLSDSQYLMNPRQSLRNDPRLAENYVNEIRQWRLAHTLSADHFSLRASWLEEERGLNFGPGSHADQELSAGAVELIWKYDDDRNLLEGGLRAGMDQLTHERFKDLEREEFESRADLERLMGGVFLRGSRVVGKWRLGAGVSQDWWQLETRSEERDANRSAQTQGAELFAEYEDDNYRGWLRYDRIFRFPVMDEVVSYQGFVLAEPVNTSLQAERGHAVELGASWENDSIFWRGTASATWLTGEIGFDFVQNLNVNFPETSRFSLENLMRWKGEGWSAQLRHRLTWARFESGENTGRDIPLVPRQVLVGSLTWDPREQFSLGIDARYISASPEGNDFGNEFPELPSRFLVDLRASWQWEDLEVFAKIENVLDRRHALLKYNSLWYPGNGRQILAGLRFDF